MAYKFSTGLCNFLQDTGSMRKAFENALINVYSGSAPIDANQAATGVLLCTFSKASGLVSPGDKGTQKITVVTVTGADTLTTVTLGGVAYTFNPGGSMTAANIAINLARVINETCPLCIAVPTGDAGILNIMSRIDGQTFNSAAAANCSISDTVAAVAKNCLQFADAAVAGVLSKNADIWSGVCLATGTAGYFRMVTTSDSGVFSTTEKRIQGNVATSGAEMNLSNLNLAFRATETIDNFTITLPASA